MADCPRGPVPDGSWQLWRQPNPPPPEMTAFAVQCLRDQARRGLPFGSTWESTWNDRRVLAIKQHHTFTHRGGKLVTGICIPGITLYWKPLDTPPGSPDSADAPTDPVVDNPAVFNDPGTDWPIVIVSGGAIVVVCTLFALALKHGGRKR